VAHAIEVIALHAARAKPPPSPVPAPERAFFSHARTCYKHLAGRLGVAWLASLEQDRLLRIRDGSLILAPRGVARFEELGLASATWPSGKPCLDWTERRNHLGGPLGVLLTQHLFALKWVARRKDGRALRVTSIGRAGFARFGLAVQEPV
jgi:hypothetical protein